MAKMRLIDSQDVNLHQDSSYKTIKKDLEQRLANAQSESEYVALISDLNDTLKAHPWGQKDKINFRNFRQKIYDRKKKIQEEKYSNIKQNIQSAPSNTNPVMSELQKSKSNQDLSSPISRNHENSSNSKERFNVWDIMLFSKNLVPILMFGVCTILTAWFVWKQSIPLYEAIGFPDPKFCALGALLMIIGFATIHSLTKSKIVLLLCLYASTYEVILIANGTLTHDSIQTQQLLENDTELIWLKAKAQHSEQSYQEIKARFDNPTSNVFQNAWYKQKYLTPAWEQYSLDKNVLLNKLNQLNTDTKSQNNSVLKILFRLGLVFLCMVSVHNFLKFLKLNSLNRPFFWKSPVTI